MNSQDASQKNSAKKLNLEKNPSRDNIDYRENRNPALLDPRDIRNTPFPFRDRSSTILIDPRERPIIPSQDYRDFREYRDMRDMRDIRDPNNYRRDNDLQNEMLVRESSLRQDPYYRDPFRDTFREPYRESYRDQMQDPIDYDRGQQMRNMTDRDMEQYMGAQLDRNIENDEIAKELFAREMYNRDMMMREARDREFKEMMWREAMDAQRRENMYRDPRDAYMYRVMDSISSREMYNSGNRDNYSGPIMERGIDPYIPNPVRKQISNSQLRDYEERNREPTSKSDKVQIPLKDKASTDDEIDKNVSSKKERKVTKNSTKDKNSKDYRKQKMNYNFRELSDSIKYSDVSLLKINKSY